MSDYSTRSDYKVIYPADYIFEFNNPTNSICRVFAKFFLLLGRKTPTQNLRPLGE